MVDDNLKYIKIISLPHTKVTLRKIWIITKITNYGSGPPDVTSLRVSMRSPNSLTIDFNLSMSATSYRVAWMSAAITDNMTVSVPPVEITGLQSGIPYNITVIAINMFAESGEAELTNEYTSK